MSELIKAPGVEALLKYINLQVAAEAFFSDENDAVVSTGRYTSVLIDGNHHTSRFSEVQAKQFIDEGWVVKAQKFNTETGFSGTLFYNEKTEEMVVSFRSTEFIDDAVNDTQVTNKGIKEYGWAFGQIADMQSWYENELKGVLLPAGKKVTVTGYSLGGHLATAFNLLYPDAVQATYTFNGAGVGTTSIPLNDVMNVFKSMWNNTGKNATFFSDLLVSQQYEKLVNKMQASAEKGSWLDAADISELMSLVNATASEDFRLLSTAALKVRDTEAEIHRLTGPDFKGIEQVSTEKIAGLSLDYWLGVLVAARLTKATNTTSPYSRMQGDPGLINNPFYDVYGLETANSLGNPSAVSNSQLHYGAPTTVYIESQPLRRGNVELDAAWDTFKYADTKLLVADYEHNDFGDTHSIILMVDSLNVQKLLVDLDPALTTDATNAIFKAASYHMAETEIGGQGKVEGDTLEKVLVALARLLGLDASPVWEILIPSLDGNTWAEVEGKGGYSGRDAFYKDIALLAHSDIYTALQGKVKIELSSPDLASRAHADFSALLSLLTLSPFTLVAINEENKSIVESQLKQIWPLVYTQWHADQLLTAEQRMAGESNFSDSYLKSRADMLIWLDEKNIRNDSNFVLSETNEDGWMFVDDESAQSVNVMPADKEGSVDLVHKVIFAKAGGDVLAGDAYGDSLYGAAGNDIIDGYEGNDYLEGGLGNDMLRGGIGRDTLLGGAGNDILKGGADNDTLMGGIGDDEYSFLTGEGLDTVIDADGVGSLRFNGITLTGGKAISNNGVVWKGKAGSLDVTYTVKPGNSGHTLTILVGGERIIVEDYHAGDLGLALEGLDEPEVPVDQLIIGTEESDTLSDGAGAGNDRILALGGNDFVSLYGAGHDEVDLGAGDDYLSGDDRDGDVVVGGQGSDVINTGDGDDLIYAEQRVDDLSQIAQSTGPGTGLKGEFLSGAGGDDLAVGSAGNDFMLGGDGADILMGGDGDDDILGDNADGPYGVWGKLNWESTREVTQGPVGPIYGLTLNGSTHRTALGPFVTNSNDIIFGGAGKDWVYAGLGNDFVDGGIGDDVLFGNAGNDTLLGGDGNDFITGDRDDTGALVDPAQANDFLSGEAGNDSMWGDIGNDRLQGGDGDDVLRGGWGSEDVLGRDTLEGDAGDDILFGDEDDDTLSGGDGDDYLNGDKIGFVGGGNDYLSGGKGEDALFGETGDDTLDGGEGNDELHGGADNDLLMDSSGDNDLSGGGGNDTVLGGSGADLIYGDSAPGFGDIGPDGADLVAAGSGKDTVYGGGGNDTLSGEAGNDELYGDAGNDTLIGGTGQDYMAGGEGDDTYLINLGDSAGIAGAGDQIEYETIFDTAAGNNVIQFGAGIALADLQVKFGTSADDLVLTFGSSEGLYIKNGLTNAIATYRFADGSEISNTDLLSLKGIELSGGHRFVHANDGKGNTGVFEYDETGRLVGSVWQNADGTKGTDTFNADGSSSGSIHLPNGLIDTHSTDVAGNRTDSFANADGWVMQRVVHPAHGPVTTTLFSEDGSHFTTSLYPDQSQDTAYYGADGQLQMRTWLRLDGSTEQINYEADGAYTRKTTLADHSYRIESNDGHGGVSVASFNAQGEMLGNTLQSADGSQTLDVVNADGTHTLHKTDAQGVVSDVTYDASDAVIRSTWQKPDGSHGGEVRNEQGGRIVSVDDGAGSSTATAFDEYGRPLSVVWHKADGSSGTDTYDTNLGNLTRVINDGLGNEITKHFGPQGNLLDDSWTRADGSSGADAYNAAGGSTGTATLPDGSYSRYVNDGKGNVTTSYFDTAGIKIQVIQQNADGTGWTDTIAPDGQITREGMTFSSGEERQQVDALGRLFSTRAEAWWGWFYKQAADPAFARTFAFTSSSVSGNDHTITGQTSGEGIRDTTGWTPYEVTSTVTRLEKQAVSTPVYGSTSVTTYPYWIEAESSVGNTYSPNLIPDYTRPVIERTNGIVGYQTSYVPVLVTETVTTTNYSPSGDIKVNLQTINAGSGDNTILIDWAPQIVDAGAGNDLIAFNPDPANPAEFEVPGLVDAQSEFFDGYRWRQTFADYYRGVAFDGPSAFLYGGSGNDTILGTTQSDELIGGAGNDFLNGNAGADTYDVLTANDQGWDTIADSGFFDQDDFYANQSPWHFLTYGGDISWLEDVKDTVAFKGNITANDLVFGWSKVADAEGRWALDISWGNDAGIHVVVGETGKPHQGIELFTFENGTQLTWEQVLALAPSNPDTLPPLVAVELPELVVLAGQPVSYRLPDALFSDGSFSIAVQKPDGSALPAWLTYDAATHTLTGTPAAGANSSLNLLVVASDTRGNRVQNPLVLSVQTKPRAVLDAGSNFVQFGDGAFTITGQDTAADSERIVLGNGNNVVRLGDGENTVSSGTGDNRITLGNGKDKIALGNGNNIVKVGDGNDEIVVGTGTNRITFGNGNDLVTAGAGDDVIDGGNGNNVVHAGNGANRVTLGTGSNTVDTGLGDDRIVLNDVAGSESTIDAGDGANRITVANGNNRIVGGVGNDVLTAGTGNNLVSLGEGNNQITLGSGSNLVSAGQGDNRLAFGDVAGSSNQVVLGNGGNRVTLGDGQNTLTIGDGINVIRGGNGANTLTLGTGANNIQLGSGDNVVSASDGANRITLGDGNSQLSLGGGNNRIVTGSGNDTVWVGGGNNHISLGGGSNHLYAGGGVNTIDAGDGNNTVMTGDGRAVVALGGGQNQVITGAGNDTVSVGNGNNDLYLGDGNNTATLGAGRNTVTVGNGRNTVTTNGGVTTVFAGEGKTTLINQGGQDTVILGAIAADHIWFKQVGSDLVVDVLGSNQEVTVKDWFGASSHHVSQFVAIDGKTISDTGVEQLVQAMAAFSPPRAAQTQFTVQEQNQLAPVLAANWH